MMVNTLTNSLPFHCQTLTLQRENQTFSAALCFLIASLNPLQNEADLFLHKEERDYLNTLSIAKRRHSYLLGRYAAKQAIANLQPPESLVEILIKPGVFTQPIVYSSHSNPCKVTLSHSDNKGIAIAFPHAHPMGIDLEVVDPKHQSLINDQLTDKEKNWIQQNASQNLYTLFWTVKEALSKALGTGLTVPLDIFAIKNTLIYQDFWISDFEHFLQYQALSFTLGNQICSIVYPQKTKLIIDLKSLKINF